MTSVGIFNAIRQALLLTSPRHDDADDKRADVEDHVADFARQREDADTKIAAWDRQTEVALRKYAPGRTVGRPPSSNLLGNSIADRRGS